MPSADALMGFGLPAQASALIGANPSARGTGTGTAQTGAKTVISKNTELTPTAGQTAYLLLAEVIFQEYFLYNSAVTAVTALVFVPSGHTLNGSLNGSLSIAQNKAAIMWQYKPTFWASILTA